VEEKPPQQKPNGTSCTFECKRIGKTIWVLTGAGKVQEAYGIGADEAEKQIRKFEERYGDWMPEDIPPPPPRDLRGNQPPRYKP
jgi:hypothetical protein